MTLPLSLLLVTIACQSVVEQGGCVQTYEFGNTGCVEIGGQVVGLGDQPLYAVLVGPLPRGDGVQFNTEYDYTDESGRFRLRLTRFVPPPPGALQDSVSIWIRATVVPQPPQDSATVFDSALVRAAVAAVGEVPQPASTIIRLPVP